MEEKAVKAKEYNRIKQKLSLIHLVFNLVVLVIPIVTPLSGLFKDWAFGITQNAYGMVALYFLFYSLYTFIVDLPFGYYSGYILEHRYELSNQNFGQWISDMLKKTSLSFVFSATLILGLYWMIWKYPAHWWLYAWIAFAAVSYGMGKLFPVLVVPLFYKYGEVKEESLKERIILLANRYGMPVENLYSINLSKTTKKANAAFMGMGKTKRVVLSDTLIDNFTHDEIETVVAHELGHFKHKDIWKQFFMGIAISYVGFWIAANAMDPLALRFGYEGVYDVASLPILFLLFYLFSLTLMPLQNGISRIIERAADRFALEAYPKVDVFISCMEKLATVNLADPDPNPIYEWLFYDHPAIKHRIEMARNWKGGAPNA